MKASDNITMQTTLESVLKDDIMQDIYVESNDVPAVPTPKQIGGLMNLGKTFIWSESELEEKRKYAEAQMVQKYGAEIYGVSAAQGSGNSLISCNVSPFVDLTHVKSEAKNDGYKKLRASCDELEKFLVGLSDEWYSANGLKKDNVRAVLDTIHEFRDTGGVADDKNKDVWKKFSQLFS